MSELLAMARLAVAAVGSVAILLGFAWAVIRKKTGWCITGAAMLAGSFLVWLCASFL